MKTKDKFIELVNKRQRKCEREGEREREILTRTDVVESYLKDLVCPFSRNTLRTFAICGTCKSPNENADGWKK